MPENNELEKTLWQAADKMRSNMDAAEYKHVVLGLIFLKYISDAFNDMHAKLVAGGGEFEGANPEDPDEYLANNVFFVPELSRWGAGRAIEAKQPRVSELFSNRPSLSQTVAGDAGFGSHTDRHSHVEVKFRGRSVAAIPSSSFGQPQGGFDQAPVLQTNSHRERQTVKTNHKARQSEQWVAKSGSKAGESRAVEALNTRMQMAAITSQTEAPRTEPLLPFGTFEEISPVAYAALLPFGKFNKRRATLLLSLSALLASCAAPATAPVIVTETRPAPAITAPAITTETMTPPARVSDGNATPAAVYAPGSNAQFVENPAIVQPFAIESLTLAPEQAAAMKAHRGLEASITAEAEGKFSTSVQILHTQGQPVTETMQVDPNTLHEDLASKNEYGNTPVMTTVDGKKLYWVQEARAWYSAELSKDPSKPVFIPFEHPEIALRVVIAEFGQPFSSEALARWLHTDGIKMMDIYVVKNAITGEDSKFGFFKNMSLNEPGITAENSPVQIVNTWFRTQLPDGTPYTYFPTKWLDPKSGTDPKGDDWKIIFCGVGDEIMGDEGNMHAFLNLLKQQFQSGQHSQISPIFRAEDGFFNSIGPIITLNVPQPSLEKLMDISGPSIDRLKNPGFDDTPYSMTFDYNFNQSSKDSPAGIAGINRTDPKYHGFFPDQIQKIIFPMMVIFH